MTTPIGGQEKEKLQLELTAVAAAVAGYFLIWPLVRPPDPVWPVVFLTDSGLGRLGLLAVLAAALAGACCLTTFSARFEGTLAAALLGLGGVSLHSGPMRQMLWLREEQLGGTFWLLAGEMLLLAVVAALAACAARLVRGVLVPAAGRWGWTDLLETLSEEQKRRYLREAGSSAGGEAGGGSAPSLLGGGFATLVLEDLALAAGRGEGRRRPDSEVLTRYVLCLLASLMLSIGLVLLLARSSQRGQVLFAVVAGCGLAAIIAYQVFPTRSALPAWIAPVVTALACYVLAAAAPPQATPGAWMDVRPFQQALPIDWLTAGVGGSLAGYCISQRIHEAKYLEFIEQQDRPEARAEGA